MAQLSSQDRLQPSLLDRLTDKDPSKTTESRDARLLSQSDIRRCVVRDLEWLLNTGRHEIDGDLSAYSEVRQSVINYGINNLAGGLVSDTDISALERDIRNSIVSFEPRVNSSSVRVTGALDANEFGQKAVSFEISADIYGDPTPMHVLLKTQLDLETGQIAVRDAGG